MASTSGLTLKDTGAITPKCAASLLILSSSSMTSTLKQRIPIFKAAKISSSRLPTPENTIFLASPPAASTRSNSPKETISKPEPNRAKTLSRAIFEFAFTA